jgi:hypothetical protein
MICCRQIPDVMDPPPLGDDTFTFEVAWEVVNKGETRHRIELTPPPPPSHTHTHTHTHTQYTSPLLHQHSRCWLIHMPIRMIFLSSRLCALASHRSWRDLHCDQDEDCTDCEGTRRELCSYWALRRSYRQTPGEGVVSSRFISCVCLSVCLVG